MLHICLCQKDLPTKDDTYSLTTRINSGYPYRPNNMAMVSIGRVHKLGVIAMAQRAADVQGPGKEVHQFLVSIDGLVFWGAGPKYRCLN